MKFRISNLSKSQLTAAIDEANLTTLQRKIVMELNSEELNDLGIMYKYHLGKEKYYAEKRIALKKIQDARVSITGNSAQNAT